MAELPLRVQERNEGRTRQATGDTEESEAAVVNTTPLDFIRRAQAARPADNALAGDIRYLWWALSEVRALTKEHMEVLDCSGWGDGIFATLMAMRMMPCEAHYLYVKNKHNEALKFRKESGADCVTVPILDGKIPECNPYDVIIIDDTKSSPAKAAHTLKQVLSRSLWRFSRVFVRNGAANEFDRVYKSMKSTMTWGRIPTTTIFHGHMSEAWCKNIVPPS